MSDYKSGIEGAWESEDGIATVFHLSDPDRVVIDTFNHNDDAASLSLDEARSLAAALLAFADLASTTPTSSAPEVDVEGD